MKIIIAGAGEVGFHLAKLLSYESQEITLIDNDKESLAYADNHLDIKVIKGDATSISALKDARILNSDLFISVTSSEQLDFPIFTTLSRPRQATSVQRSWAEVQGSRLYHDLKLAQH